MDLNGDGIPDGIDTAIEAQLQQWIASAQQVAQQAVMARTQALSVEKRHTDAETAKLQADYEAQKVGWRKVSDAVYRDAWWDQANPEEIGTMYTGVAAWALEDPTIEAARRRMCRELEARYGLDMRHADIDAHTLEASVREAEKVVALKSPSETVSFEVEQGAPVVQLVDPDLVDDAVQPVNDASPIVSVSETESSRVKSARHRSVAYNSEEGRAARLRAKIENGLPEDLIATAVIADVAAAPVPAIVGAKPGPKAKVARPSGERHRSLTRTR